MRQVNHNDEWCAEAYMVTDYEKLGLEDFYLKVKEYIAFAYLNNIK